MSLVDASTGEVVVRSFAENEATIERGLGTFVEVGEALMAIRDGRQYRDHYSDFDTYCRERWGFDRVYAHRLIGASEIAEVLPMGNKPTSERQARALAPLRHNPEAMAEVMSELWQADQDRITARKIAEKVAEKVAAVDDLKRGLAEQAEVVDELSQHLPDDFDPALNRELVRQRGELSRLCNDLVAIGDPSDFLARHGGGLLDAHRQRVSSAAAWLTTLDNMMEEG